MNYFRTCDANRQIIKAHSISTEDLELFRAFLSTDQIYNIYFNTSKETFEQNIPLIVSQWFKFLQQHKKVPVSVHLESDTFETPIFRATFGCDYTLEQIAKNPLYYSKGSNGTGLYAVDDTHFGLNYLKHHLLKRFSAFDDKVGNILKIGVSEDATVMSKSDIMLATKRFIEEIRAMNISPEYKHAFIRLLTTDVSISALLLGADMMFMVNGHVVVLNKKALILPKTATGFERQTLQVDLERFRSQDALEQEKVNAFLQPQ